MKLFLGLLNFSLLLFCASSQSWSFGQLHELPSKKIAKRQTDSTTCESEKASLKSEVTFLSTKIKTNEKLMWIIAGACKSTTTTTIQPTTTSTTSTTTTSTTTKPTTTSTVPTTTTTPAIGGSIAITCRYYDWSSWTGWDYSCDILGQDLKTTRYSRQVTSVSGTHLSGWSNYYVKCIWAPSSTILFLPRGITSYFPNMECIQIESAKLQEITKDDLQQFGNKLKRLWLNNNEIQSLDSDTFVYSKGLVLVDLSYNKISKIGLGTFSGLSLQTLNLAGNPCTSVATCSNFRSDLMPDEVANAKNDKMPMTLEGEEIKNLTAANLKLIEENKKVSNKLIHLERIFRYT